MSCVSLCIYMHVYDLMRTWTTTQVPDVKWEDVGSLGDIREELNLSICEPILHPAKFAALGVDPLASSKQLLAGRLDFGQKVQNP